MPRTPRLTSSTLRRGAIGVGLVAAVAATGLNAAPAQGATTAHTASNAHNPHGTFHVTVQGRHVHVWGTAADPDSGAARVMISVAGQPDRVVKANAGGYHAFGYWTWLSFGYHRITARALNHGAGRNVVLGSERVAVRNMAKYNPHGTLHVIRHQNSVRFYGRVADPSTPNRPVTIRLFHDGQLVATTRSNAASHTYVVHGKLAEGANSFRVAAVNSGSGTANAILGRYSAYRGYAWILQYHGNRRIAAEMLPSYGWGADQMKDLDQMWYMESHWLTQAANPSGAYGIPQAYPGYKMASAGADWRTNPRTQIRWGLTYIKQRYGSPAAAWYAHQYLGGY